MLRRAVVALLEALSLARGVRRGLRVWRSRGVPRVRPRVVRTLPHDPAAFTQGLCYWQGHLYESTGVVGASSIRCIDPRSGALLRSIPVEGVWGEGLAIRDGRVIQLTYTSGIANIFALPELNKVGEYRYSGEGWGLASYEDLFMMTDGSDRIAFRNRDFSEAGGVRVRIGASRLKGLNDLEYAAGCVYANAYYDDFIYEISPLNGRVLRVVDCEELVAAGSNGGEHNILNGIACAPERGTFFVTGKNWNRIFEIAIPPAA